MAKRGSRDVYQEVTDRIIRLIESGVAQGSDWIKPWATVAGEGLPVNAITHKQYRGINVLLLWGAAMIHGHPTNEWGSFRQWQSRGAMVRKGEHGERIVFFRQYEKDDDEAENGKRRVLVLRDYTVFNAEQVDGYEPEQLDEDELNDLERIEACETYIGATGATIRHGGGRAAYTPGTDSIICPELSRFKSEEAYYSTMFHELTHWTGHKKRLDRQLTGDKGKAEYAAEELIAELGAAFQCGRLGLSPVAREDHAQYIDNWLSLLRHDKKAIVTASSRAADAAEYLSELTEKEVVAA